MSLVQSINQSINLYSPKIKRHILTYTFIHLVEERQSGVKFLLEGNSANAICWEGRQNCLPGTQTWMLKEKSRINNSSLTNASIQVKANMGAAR